MFEPINSFSLEGIVGMFTTKPIAIKIQKLLYFSFIVFKAFLSFEISPLSLHFLKIQMQIVPTINKITLNICIACHILRKQKMFFSLNFLE